MPCIDSLDFDCKWKFQIIVPKTYTVVASGALISIEECCKNNKKLYIYDIDTPNTCCKVGLAIGEFLPIYSDNDIRINYFCCSFNDLTLIERHIIDTSLMQDVRY